MSESSEERTKRTYIHYLHACEWKYQYSIFYCSLSDSKEADIHAHKLKRNISRAFEVPLLHRLSLKGGLDSALFSDLDDGHRVMAAWHSFLTTEKLDKAKFQTIAERVVGGEVKLVHKRISPDKLESIKSAITVQKPHNLVRFFGKSNIQRISLLNKKAIKLSILGDLTMIKVDHSICS